MKTPSPHPCFFCHKCNDQTHHFGEEVLAAIFRKAEIDLVIDPAGPGVEIGARLATIPFHALVFLSSQESLASAYCRAELSLARLRGVPIFLVRWDDAPAPGLRKRIAIDGFGRDEEQLAAEIASLAEQVRVRARLYSHIECLHTGNTPDVIRDAAQAIAMEPDAAALAEAVARLAKIYQQDMDPVARYWMAIALGGARIPLARSVLLRWRDAQDHPYPQEGIRKALAMLAHF